MFFSFLFWVVAALAELCLVIVAIVAGFKEKQRLALASFLSAIMVPIFILIFLELLKLAQGP